MKKELSPAKRALLEKWLKGKQAVQQETGIKKRPSGAPIPLSFPQQRQLFLEMLDRDTAVNNLSIFLKMDGDLNIEALNQSANEILARHEILRTRFSFGQGMPSPDVLDSLTIRIPIIEFPIGNEELIRKHAEKEVLIPFDLSQAPLIRLVLYEIHEMGFHLLLVAHHTVADGWSLGVFLSELMHFYRKNAHGEHLQMTPLPIQYGDYAYWQNEQLNSDTLAPSLSFWKKKLGDELPVLNLPTDRKRGARQSFNGGTYRFIIPKKKVEKLEELGRKQDATLFMSLLSIFYILLHKYSGQDDLLIGTPIANRNHPELQNLIGVFINTLVLRSSLADDPSFSTLLASVRKDCLDSYAHQDFPFEKLVEELKPQRDLSRTPIFQVVFNLQSAPLPKLDMPEVETAFLNLDRGVSQFDLTLMISKIAGACHASVAYNSDLFDRSTIQSMFHAFQLLLAEAISRPEAPISRLKWINPDDLKPLTVDLNQTAMEVPDSCMHQLFEQQAALQPEKTACIFGETSLSYAALNQQANALAAHLMERGIRKGKRVGLLMKRSSEMLTALLAVHKVGGIYVPIHTGLPAARIQFILQDAEIQLLLTNFETQALDKEKANLLHIKELDLHSVPSSQLPSPPGPADLAYIIYTSGSTGQPKGVMVQHAALTNFLWSMKQKPGIRSEDVLLAVTSLSFDIAGLELFLPLIAGATVVIASDEMPVNPALLAEGLKQHQVSIMQATPATWQLLLDTRWRGKKDLKALCGGEALSRKLANQLASRVRELWNMYGPTETTIWSTVSQIHKGRQLVDVGFPIGNTQVYVLDKHLQPLPRGVVGELYIGGAGLAKGYLNRPDLTAERFIQNPFPTDTPDILYKTGDLARFLPNHRLEILGRTDHQVKVNGHRIELGEIRYMLNQYPAVRDSLIVAEKQRLLAYFVAEEAVQPASAELRAFLREKVPAYMIPALFIPLKSFPLNPNGKVDRKRLPLPEDSRPGHAYAAPRSETEQILVNIWQHVLEIERVGIQDNFFDLGGASIQSIQIVAQANMYGYRIGVEHIFEYQTVEELAAFIKRRGEEAGA